MYFLIKEEKMTQKTTPGYNNVVINIVNKALEASKRNPDTIAGFCQLQGPTGGGKTSALYSSRNSLPSALEYNKSKGLRTIFVTHRWNILNGVTDSILKTTDRDGDPLTVSVIYKIRDNVETTIRRIPLPHEKKHDVDKLPKTEDAIDELDALGFFETKKDAAELKTLCDDIEIKALLLEEERKRSRNDSDNIKIDELEDELNNLCSIVENILLGGLYKLDEELESAKKLNKSKEDDPTIRKAQNRKLKIRQNSWLRRIFPAIAWYDDEQHLLVLTTQKLYASFYNGVNKVRLSSNRLSGNIIYIDEFDYQSDVLQEQLAQSQIVREPPECIGQLLYAGKRAIARITLTAEGELKDLCDTLNKELKNLESELNAHGIDLERSRALIIPYEDYKNRISLLREYLFRADHFITSGLLMLKQTDAGFEVVKDIVEGEEYIDFAIFITLIEKYIRRFSLILSNHNQNEIKAYKELRDFYHVIFDAANDYILSHYNEALREHAFNYIPQTGLPELEQISKTNRLLNTHAHLFGLTTWFLTKDDKHSDFDPLRVEIRRALLPTTAEGLITSLASRNLVFALSATSYIERALGHFDVRWIEKALKYIGQIRNPECHQSFLGDEFKNRPNDWFKKPIPYLQDDEDSELLAKVIQDSVMKKTQQRATEVEITPYNFDKAIVHEFNNSKELTADFFETKNDTEFKYRKQRLFKFLHIMRLAEKQTKHKGHLIFVDSFKYIQKWLCEDIAKISRGYHSWLKVDPNPPYFIDAKSPFTKYFLSVLINDRQFIICLLNANAQRLVGFDKVYQAAFDTGKPVIVLTQIATATNGINLDYLITNELGQRISMDLTALYIIDSKHFYFSRYNKSNSRHVMAHAGYQLRNVEKLVRFGEFSVQDKRDAIVNIMSNSYRIGDTNELYKQTTDYIKNLAADIQQQVGRIERSWDPVPYTSIFICEQIALLLGVFVHSPIWTNHQHLASDLNKKLFNSLISYQPAIDMDQLLMQMKTNSQDGSEAIKIIDENIDNAIKEVRKNPELLELTTAFWNELGEAVMKLDYNWQPSKKYESLNHGIKKPLYRWACFTRPNNFLKTGEIWYDPKNWTFYDHRNTQAIRKYDPFKDYVLLNHFPSLNKRFNQKGYKVNFEQLDCPKADQYALHPHVVQRILQGRFGEECIQILLNGQSLSSSKRTYEHALFELYDFEVLNTNAFVDAKYWSLSSRNRADKEFRSFLESGKTTDSNLVRQVIHNLKEIKKHRGNDAILIVANLLSKDGESSLLGFKDNMEPIEVLENASILILSACVTYNEDGNYDTTSSFERLCDLLKRRQKE